MTDNKLIGDLTEQINTYLQNLGYMRHPKMLYEPIGYALSLGGKRLRPLLALMSCALFGADPHKALPAAAAIEMYHNHTLLHDDVMDKAEMRRNKPCVHKLWGENAAILSGDAMLILAYKILNRCEPNTFSKIYPIFNETTLQICEGQQMDLEFEKKEKVNEAEYMEMIRLKTAVLLACALKCGALSGGASDTDADTLYDFGIGIGLAFQLQDDILDVYGDPTVFGKKLGGDILCAKKTYLLIKAQECGTSSEKAELKRWIDDTHCSDNEKIAAVTHIYNKVGVQEMAHEKMEECFASAMRSLHALKADAAMTDQLRSLATNLMNRTV